MMKKIFNILFILLMFSCEEKHNKIRNSEAKSIDSTRNKLVSQNNKLEKSSEILIKKQNQKTVDCKDKGGNMENGFVTECFYKNYELEEAYNAFRERNKANDDGKFLEKKLPIGQHTAGFSDYPISVTYNYPKQNILEIEILFPGGVTIINFNKEKDDVMVNINHSPD